MYSSYKRRYEKTSVMCSKRRHQSSSSETEADNRRKYRLRHYSSNQNMSSEVPEKRHRKKYKEMPEDTVKYYTQVAIKYFHANKLSKALKYINLALKLSKNREELSKLYQIRGKCYAALEEKTCSMKAVLDYERALNHNKHNEKAQKALSQVLFIAANKHYRNKEYSRAIFVGEKSLKLFRANSNASALLKHLKKKFPDKNLNVEEIKPSFQEKSMKSMLAPKNDAHYTEKWRRSTGPPTHAEKLSGPKQHPSFSENPSSSVTGLNFEESNNQLHDAKYYTDLAIKEFELKNLPRSLIFINKALRTYPCEDGLMNKLHEMKKKIIQGMKQQKVICDSPVETVTITDVDSMADGIEHMEDQNVDSSETAKKSLVQATQLSCLDALTDGDSSLKTWTSWKCREIFFCLEKSGKNRGILQEWLKISKIFSADFPVQQKTVRLKGDTETREEVVHALYDQIAGSTVEQILHLIQSGIIAPVCNLLPSANPDMTKLLLDILCNILSAALKADKLASACSYIEYCNGLNNIENLQYHQNMDIYKKASSIITTYFGVEHDEKNETEDEGSFSFAEPIPVPESISIVEKEKEEEEEDKEEEEEEEEKDKEEEEEEKEEEEEQFEMSTNVTP